MMMKVAFFVALFTEQQQDDIKGCTYQGLRANAASALIAASCNNDEIKSITGHKTNAMVKHYTSTARKKLDAKRAMKKLTNM